MKIGDAMKTVYSDWVQKRKGYRVRYQFLDGEDLVTDYTPQPDERLLDSEVFARTLAWKLSQATGTSGSELAENELVNLVVVDEENDPIASYVTGQVEIFNPYEP